jgi:O-antigen/teichoic acid export membrane protein
VEPSSDAALPAPAFAGTEFAGKARTAVAWATGLQFFRDVVQFAFTLILVRLLPIGAYGQFGFLTALLTFFTYYSFREFLNHTLQVGEREEIYYQDHFTAGAVIQTVIVVCVNLTALAFRWIPAYAPVSTVLHVMSLLFVIDLPAEFRTRMLEREFDWRRLRLLQGLGFFAGALLSLAMAVAGLGVWALIIPTLAVPLPFVYDLFVTARFRPTWAFSWDRFRPAWQFGLARVLTLTLLAIASVTESLSLTSVLGFAALGIFGRALGLAQVLCGRLATLLAVAIYPVLARVPRSSDASRRFGALYLRAVGWSVIPAAVLAALLADPIVRTLYGLKWVGAIPFVPWAMAGAALAAIVQTSYTVLLSNGRQRDCLKADVWRMTGVLLALAVALRAGPGKYLAALCLVHVVSLLVVSRLLSRARVLDWTAVVDAVAPAATSAVLGAAVVMGMTLLLGTRLDSIRFAALVIPVFVLTYLGALRLLFRARLAEVVGQLPRSRNLARALRLA